MGAEFSSELDGQEKRDLLRQCGARYRLATGARALARLAWAPLAAVAIVALAERGVGGHQPLGNAIAAGGLLAFGLVACVAEKMRAFIIDKITDKQACKPALKERRAVHFASKWLGLALFALMAIHFHEQDALDKAQQEEVASKISKMSALDILRSMRGFSRTQAYKQAPGEEPSSAASLFEPENLPKMALAVEMKRRGFHRQEDEERVKAALLSEWISYKPSSYWAKYGPVAMSTMMAAALALSLCIMARSRARERGFKYRGGRRLATSMALWLMKAGKAAGVGAIKAPWQAAMAMGRVMFSLAKTVVRAPGALLAAPKGAAAIAGDLAKSCARARQSLIDRGMGGAKGWSEAERDQIAAEIPQAQPAASTRRRL